MFASLDADVTIHDFELDAQNGSAGDYAGASATILRHGAANAEDVFGFDLTGASFTLSGNNLQVGGLTFATFSNTAGTQTINFTSSGAPATTFLVNDVLQHLTYANQSDNPPANVTLDYTFSDGQTALLNGAQAVTQSLSVTIQATNDAAVIGGVATGDVTEDVSVIANVLSTAGALTISDADQGQATFAPQAGTAGSNGHGNFTLAADGSWTYSADNTQTAIQQLGAGQSLTDSFTAHSSDGSAGQTITVTIHGTNDAAVIGGVATGDVTEDVSVIANVLSTAGALTISDADQGQATFAPQAGTAGSNGHGNFTLAADGSWTYSADNTQTAIQQLGAGQSLTDSFTAHSSDGSAGQTITVTIHGTNDAAVIGGVATGDVTEDVSVIANVLSTAGALTISDADQGQATFAPQAGTAGSNGHGNFTLAADGSWTYSADNTQTAIQQLGAGQSLTDSFTAHSSDGSAGQTITVTIHGTNDAAVIGGVATGDVTEDVSVIANVLSTAGALTISDADQGQATFAPQAGTAGSNGHGNFTLAADGSWTYSADNTQTAIQQLGAGQSLTDSFTAHSSDGSAGQTITVTIHGTNDAAVIGGVATGPALPSTFNIIAGGGDRLFDFDLGTSGQTAYNYMPQTILPMCSSWQTATI